ncbi:hypothetical protein CR513_13728, partial [Mucuna pruriens]
MVDTTSENEDDEEVTFNYLIFLQIPYQELLSNSSTLFTRYKVLKKKFFKLTREFDSLKKENDILKKEMKNMLNSRKKTPVMVPGQWLLTSHDRKKVYVPRLETKDKCMISINNDQWTWQKKLGHASLGLISKLKKNNLMRRLPCFVYKTNFYVMFVKKGNKPTRTSSLGEKYYGLVVVYDYSIWTWVMFLAHKDEYFKVFSIFYKQVQTEKGENLKIQTFNNSVRIRNSLLFFCPRMPQQNGDNLEKFDPKLNKGTFLRYSIASKTYRVYNSRNLIVEESIHIKFNDYKLDKELSNLNDSFAYLNLGDLQMLSKEFGLDDELKESIDFFKELANKNPSSKAIDHWKHSRQSQN